MCVCVCVCVCVGVRFGCIHGRTGGWLNA